MKRLLVMCEGSNEKKIMDILLEHSCLTFSEDDLLGLSIFHARQIKNNAQVKLELNMFPGEVEVLVDAIKQYQKLKGKAHGKDEFCLAELLR
ncbi:hypothetical protein SAMN02745247_01547 [Butyrivibrio hungatei DSM 14810]|uniref:Uncharacterized protein n=1 Tax=Butyrivibrio hungatei DSM 14810 TaxID=1121132 RepID=A0A1M7SEG1_9FIRM|nr:hypothetical protein [Butyrivibrio hungatei]SHN56662.1 hypothetical protein SAMN02745247_01547 [Butyrivibrio hungatei DSM 14810]